MDYTFDNLKQDLSMGREIEFIYLDRRFSITNTPYGWSLAEFYKEEIQIYSSHQELLLNGTVDGSILQDIWSHVRVDAVF
jgi:hypothetical protein